jgi:indole-3-glycerol phosphate synthase
VLLITRILAPPALRDLLDLSAELGIAALVECHDEADVAQAVRGGAGIIGVNNRDLATLDVSLEAARRLGGMIPDGVLRVCESGIQERAQIESMRAVGFDAFLVGGALLNAIDPGKKLRELRGMGPPGAGDPAEEPTHG